MNVILADKLKLRGLVFNFFLFNRANIFMLKLLGYDKR